MGTVQEMSAQGSNQEETEWWWWEASAKANLTMDLSKWTEEDTSLGDSLKPMWSIGIGKKDDWEGKLRK